MNMKANPIIQWTWLCLGLVQAACGADEPGGSGTVTVLLESEDAVVQGMEPGDETENIRDGWAVEFDQYVATIGDIDTHLGTDDSVQAEAGEVFVVDLTQVPATGLALWTLEGLEAGRWDFYYATRGAGDGSTRHDSVVQADYDEMVTNDWTYLVNGTLTKADGQSCPPADLADPGSQVPNGNTSGNNPCYDAASVRFTIAASAETAFGPCEIDEIPGFAIAPSGAQTVSATLHGDHLFFNGFPEGSESGVTRLAQWLADCDLNLDGTVTTAELESIAPDQLVELDDRFQLGGSPIAPLNTMYDYVASQLKTQGHFQGEGECPIDGVEHEHEDE